MKFQFDDGGRQAAGYRGFAGDCVCRAIAIATKKPYQEIYERLAVGNGSQRAGRRGKRPRSARNGINTKRKWFIDYMRELWFTWHACMGIGTGCRIHLLADELPSGRLVVSVSNHYTVVIDGVIHDTFDPSREGTRCVYGYWTLDQQKESYG